MPVVLYDWPNPNLLAYTGSVSIEYGWCSNLCGEAKMMWFNEVYTVNIMGIRS